MKPARSHRDVKPGNAPAGGVLRVNHGIEVERVPAPGLRGRLADLLIELLDEHGRGHSGGG